jgi:hypothetical protein
MTSRRRGRSGPRSNPWVDFEFTDSDGVHHSGSYQVNGDFVTVISRKTSQQSETQIGASPLEQVARMRLLLLDGFRPNAD